jgi:hypothetical protein
MEDPEAGTLRPLSAVHKPRLSVSKVGGKLYPAPKPGAPSRTSSARLKWTPPA